MARRAGSSLVMGRTSPGGWACSAATLPCEMPWAGRRVPRVSGSRGNELSQTTCGYMTALRVRQLRLPPGSRAITSLHLRPVRLDVIATVAAAVVVMAVGLRGIQHPEWYRGLCAAITFGILV